jgi:hypothetical protein
MNPNLQEVYDQLRERELDTREKIFRTYPSFVATGVPGRIGKAVRPNVVRSWWRHERVFASPTTSTVRALSVGSLLLVSGWAFVLFKLTE